MVIACVFSLKVTSPCKCLPSKVKERNVLLPLHFVYFAFFNVPGHHYWHSMKPLKLPRQKGIMDSCFFVSAHDSKETSLVTEETEGCKMKDCWRNHKTTVVDIVRFRLYQSVTRSISCHFEVSPRLTWKLRKWKNVPGTKYCLQLLFNAKLIKVYNVKLS